MFFIQNIVVFWGGGGIRLRKVGFQKVVIGVLTPLHQLESEKRGEEKTLLCIISTCYKKRIKNNSVNNEK